MMRRILLSCILLLCCPICLNAAGVRQKTIRKQAFSHLGDLMTGNRFAVVFRKNHMTASGRGFTCTFTRDQRRFLCNNTRIELLNPLVSDGNSLWISSLDWFKTLRPLFFPATVPRKKISRIMIDMGHGGADPGAGGAFSKEKTVTLKIGLRTAELLRANGFQVSTTRNSDVQVPLSQIGTMQRRSGSDLFVSIHANSEKTKSISGIETYCLTPTGASSSNGGKLTWTKHPGNSNDAANFLLAWHIQRALLRSTGAVDRGVKRARFAVLRDINVPGVLIETGFISNRAEERKLNDPAYIDRIARGIVEGIINFSRSTKPR